MVALLPLHMDQPEESRQLYRCGIQWLHKAETLLGDVNSRISDLAIAHKPIGA
jgi:hypothetical protein